MSAKFFAILTHQGAARLANAAALGTTLNLTHMAVGDANGSLPVPDPVQTKLLNQKRIAPLNLLSIDPNNTSQIIAEQIIPENEGGFWIREIGLYDDAGILIAVANCPETYKPQLQEGSGRTQTIRMVLIVSSTESVTLKIDPAVVLATRKYVDDKIIEVKVYADDLLVKHVAAVNPHNQYAPKNSPALTGKPTAPTAAQTENSTQLATTEFVKAALAALVASSPEQLDTLNELAAALGNDANFAATMTSALAGKQPLNTTLTALSGKDVAGLLQYLGLGEGSALPVGVPVPWPLSSAPTGWLKYNGAAFDKNRYPELGAVYPGGVLPDLRGEFIRGWDDGRGVDSSRALLSAQGDAYRSHNHIVTAFDAYNSDVLNPNDKAGDMILSTDNAVNGTNGGVNARYITNAAGSTETRPRNVAFNYIVRAA